MTTKPEYTLQHFRVSPALLEAQQKQLVHYCYGRQLLQMQQAGPVADAVQLQLEGL
jgi:hypothetical protein